MPEIQPRPGDDGAAKAWQKVRTMAEKLYAACDELEEAGGIRRAVKGWTPKSIDKSLATLRAARAALDAQVRELEQRASGRSPRGPKAP